MSERQDTIVRLIARRAATALEIAEQTSSTNKRTHQQLLVLEQYGRVERSGHRVGSKGRPSIIWRLSNKERAASAS